MIEAKIIADSIGPCGVRITTFVLTYPRFIHAEFMTHRVFSRNASSSRAIPVKKQIQMVIDNPAIPLVFRKNQKGMQAGDPLEDQDAARKLWLEARDLAVECAKKMADMEIHKQYANRILEPYAHISVVVTSTDFDNFFALRTHKDAQPEIGSLAEDMYHLFEYSSPRPLKEGEWHLPFITEEDYRQTAEALMGVIIPTKEEMESLLIKRSVAKCARVSYLTHEGKQSTLEEDLALYDRLLSSQPLHASPAEHQAQAISNFDYRSGNLRGWLQYRKVLPNNDVTDIKKYLNSLSPEKLAEYSIGKP